MHIGVQRFLRHEAERFRGQRVGLICHQASVADGFRSSADLLVEHGGLRLAALFGPQHGIRGEKQDNMVESDSFIDPRHDIPVYSLYGAVRKPTAEMLDGLDVVLFDLQDVGVRVYTFVWTMTLVMEACREAGVRFVVLDRPNPIGGTLREGPVLKPGFESFVGRYPVPLRHGLTAGEIAHVVNEEFGVDCELEVIPCKGWRRDQWFDETGLPFVPPSPNLPTLDSCTVYPGMVLVEGTNLSEGRGTTRPFELVGAPFLQPERLGRTLDAFNLSGVVFRPCYFEPTFQKHAGEICGGVQLHVTDRSSFQPVRAAVAVLIAASKVAPDHFAWRTPPYEYETEKMPIDVLWGGSGLREMVDAGAGPDDVLFAAEEEIRRFEELVGPWLEY